THGPGVPGGMLAGGVRAVATVERAGIAVVGARQSGRALRIRWTRRRAAGARLRRIAFTGRRAAHDRRGGEAIAGARGARPGAGLGDVAHAGRRATDGASVARRMLAGDARAVALVHGARVAVVGACASRGPLRVGGAARPAAGARLRRDAVVRGRATDRARRREAVGRAARARSGAGLRHVTGARRRPAHRPGVPGGVLAGDAAAVALVHGARVAVVGARRAGGLLRVGGAARPAPGARLRQVALVRSGTTDRARRREAVGRAARARSGAGLRDVTGARRRPAHRPGIPGGVPAVDAAAVALIERAGIAVVAARGPGRLARVGWAGRGRSRARFRQVADPCSRTADDRRRLEVAGRRTAVAVGNVAVVTFLGPLEDAVAAHRVPADRDERDAGRVGLDRRGGGVARSAAAPAP